MKKMTGCKNIKKSYFYISQCFKILPPVFVGVHIKSHHRLAPLPLNFPPRGLGDSEYRMEFV